MEHSQLSATEAKRAALNDASMRAARFIEGMNDRDVMPSREALEALGEFPTELGADGQSTGEVLELLDRLGSPATVAQHRGRYFGYVNGGIDPAALGAAVLTTAWDQNVALPAISPIGAHLDQIAARWVIELLGLPTSSIAAFCSGASIANLTCVLAARDALLARRGWSVDRDGLAGSPPITVVASAEIHSSVRKALRAAGIGTAQVVDAPVDSNGACVAMNFPEVDDLTIVLLQAGNVDTGHSDPFADIIPQAHEAGAWVHVDGAFGLWAAASPLQRHRVLGVELADSWATDAHKWLNAPYDSGVAIVRDEAALRRAMSFDAAYFTTDSDRALAHLGLQMSQRARAIETWAILSRLGRHGVAGLVDHLTSLSERMAQALADANVEVLVEPALNQTLVAFGTDEQTDEAIEAIQRSGVCWAGATTWQGRRALRISICDAATTTADIDEAAKAIVAMVDSRP
jgi:glutamate/tyrosine decarboxylase-like PLP-dependent enzyme